MRTIVALLAQLVFDHQAADNNMGVDGRPARTSEVPGIDFGASVPWEMEYI